MHCPAGASQDGSEEGIMEDLKTVQLPFDGCLFKNKTYAKDERYSIILLSENARLWILVSIIE